jgi:hypothetical protein
MDMHIIERIFARIGDGLALLHSAAAASEAVANGRRPALGDLKVLGINPAAFAGIGRG